jgi:energy-coupling factor transport system permease protein
MLTTWQYRPRDTFIQRLDPRVRLIFYACFLVSVFLFWDVRVLSLFLLISFTGVISAKLSWRDTKRSWVLLFAFVAFFSLSSLFGTHPATDNNSADHILFVLQAPFVVLGWQPGMQITRAQVFLALSQFTRISSIAAMTVLIPYTFDPAQYGITFRKLGLPDKLAFAFDLTMRFVPSLGRDFQMTMDAQRARGYELERREGGLIGRVRRLAPLLVPVVIHSIANGEEITDAMDLRAFGTQRRTWLRQLQYRRLDYVVIVCSLLLLTASITATILGIGKFWVP